MLRCPPRINSFPFMSHPSHWPFCTLSHFPLSLSSCSFQQLILFIFLSLHSYLLIHLFVDFDCGVWRTSHFILEKAKSSAGAGDRLVPNMRGRESGKFFLRPSTDLWDGSPLFQDLCKGNRASSGTDKHHKIKDDAFLFTVKILERVVEKMG